MMDAGGPTLFSNPQITSAKPGDDSILPRLRPDEISPNNKSAIASCCDLKMDAYCRSGAMKINGKF
jgi:hypothetical protein